MKCVRALQKQTIADRMEILVVDNHSDDESIGLLRNHLRNERDVRIVETARNKGFGLGYNLGFAHARGEFILINNPAKVLEPGSVERMIEEMQRDPGIGIIGPKLEYPDGTLRDSFRHFPRMADVVIKRTFLKSFFPERVRYYTQSDRDPNAQQDTDWLIGGCLLLRRDFVQQLGGFDPRYFLFFEDIDLCRRCWVAGKRVVYFPQAHGSDRKSRLSEGGPLTLLTSAVGRSHIASALRYFWKWRGQALPRQTGSIPA